MEINSSKEELTFVVNLIFQGKTVPLSGITLSISYNDLYRLVRGTLLAAEHSNSSNNNDEGNDTILFKLLYKGKQLQQQKGDIPLFGTKIPKKIPKILVLATGQNQILYIQQKKSDPTIRGFSNSNQESSKKTEQYWSPNNTSQDKTYKFCRFETCSWQSFGHRPTDETPHAFAALRLLGKLATDPGIVAIMKERELVVNTLGEMDPVDDRLMQKKEEEGGCLLGYNTNAGLRIDIKLRTDDLKAFRPYPELASTLIHELSHNWVSDHNLLFWTNFGQMRAEYIHTHVASALSLQLVNGKTTADIAGIAQIKDVYKFCMKELEVDMSQHRLHPRMIASAIRERCRELDKKVSLGQRLGGSGDIVSNNSNKKNSRELAFAAAEKRIKDSENKKR